MRESLTAVRLTGVSADGATTPETLRQRGPRGWTIWREALQRAHRRGHPRRVVRVKLSGTATDGDRWPACRPGPTLFAGGPSWHISLLSAPGSPASPRLTHFSIADTPSPCSTVTAMRRWKRP